MDGKSRRGLRKKEEGGWTWNYQPMSDGRLLCNKLRELGTEYSDVQILTIMRLSLQASRVVNRTHERKLHEPEYLVKVPQSTFQPS